MVDDNDSAFSKRATYVKKKKKLLLGTTPMCNKIKLPRLVGRSNQRFRMGHGSAGAIKKKIFFVTCFSLFQVFTLFKYMSGPCVWISHFIFSQGSSVLFFIGRIVRPWGWVLKVKKYLKRVVKCIKVIML